MGTKNNPGKYDCYENLDPDEPYFVLMGHDKSAHHLVRAWATGRLIEIKQNRRPESDMPQVDEAFQCAAAMEQWLVDHPKPGEPPHLPMSEINKGGEPILVDDAPAASAPEAAPPAASPADTASAAPKLPGSGL